MKLSRRVIVNEKIPKEQLNASGWEINNYQGKFMKCNYCEKNLVEIIIKHEPTGYSATILGEPDNERVELYVCTSRDCKNCGVVLAIPTEAKD